MTSKVLRVLMNKANALGMSSIKYSHKWGWKCARQRALEETAKKRYQMFRKLTQMEHKMPLRDTTEVQMKPCPKALHRAADGRQEHGQKGAVTCCLILQNMLSKAVCLSSKHQPQSLTLLPGTVLPRQGRGEQDSFPVKVCCWRIQTTVKGSCDNRILKLDRSSKGTRDKAKKTTDH